MSDNEEIVFNFIEIERESDDEDGGQDDDDPNSRLGDPNFARFRKV